jgi:hypothetical protein
MMTHVWQCTGKQIGFVRRLYQLCSDVHSRNVSRAGSRTGMAELNHRIYLHQLDPSFGLQVKQRFSVRLGNQPRLHWVCRHICALALVSPTAVRIRRTRHSPVALNSLIRSRRDSRRLHHPTQRSIRSRTRLCRVAHESKAREGSIVLSLGVVRGRRGRFGPVDR